MSEVDTRPPATRGRSAYRGGRGGVGRGGGRGGRKAVNGTTSEALQLEESFDDQGEIGEMKKQYSSQIVQLKELFPDWTSDDLAFALQESDGDVAATVDKITQGSVSQFSEVKSAKDRARSKVKEAPTTGQTDKSASRGGRGRGGADSVRGGRGRGPERGRGGFRGARGGHATTNGAPKDAATTSVPTTESTAWGDTSTAIATEGGWDTTAPDTTKDSTTAGQSAWADVITADATPAAASEGVKSSLVPESGPKKSWAAMAAPKPPPVVKKASVQQAPPAESQVAQAQSAKALEVAPVPPVIQEPPGGAAIPPGTDTLSEKPSSVTEGEDLQLTPSKDPLTEENVEHLPDESHPPATATAASTAGSNDPRNLTPLPGQQAPIARPPLGGYATSAYRATGGAGRSASFQRRVQEQQEAVVMPGHNAMDRAAVQFGSMGLNGEPGLDVDDDREEAETRHAPQHSPPSQPRTSLPPAPRQTTASQEPVLPESLPTPKQAPGLPPASVQNQQMQDTLPPGLATEASQMSQNYAQFGRYGAQPGMQQDSTAQQKPYDPFSHQAQSGQYDQYPTHNQQAPPQQQSQSGFGGLSSAPNEYSQYYTSDHQRQAYSNYYGSSYGPQDVRSQLGPGQVAAELGQQRSGSGFGSGPNESAFSSQMQQQAQSRFADTTGSGHNTPNPIMGGQQQTAPSTHQAQHSIHQTAHHQQGGYGAGPYGHPSYYNPYQQQGYGNQYGYSNQISGYGGGYGPGKHGGMYGGSQGYSMPHSSYDQHSASPANAGAFGQNNQSSMRSASGMSAGLGNLDEYSRSSAQSGAHQQSGAFGNMNENFPRSTSGFGGPSSYGQQSMAQQEDSLKPYADSKSGPSPALGQPGGRPGSAANSAGGNAQSGLPPPQSHQSSFGAYGNFPNQGGYGGLGGLGNQQGQNTMAGQGGYSNYNSTNFSQYGSYSSRGGGGGGWGSNYGH